MQEQALETYSDEETTRRARDALRRALNTPPQPHTAAKPKAAKPPGPVKARASRKLATAGKPAPSA
jgi:hypothetical protein